MRLPRTPASEPESSIEEPAQPIANLFANLFAFLLDGCVDLLLDLLAHDRVEVRQHRRRIDRARDFQRHESPAIFAIPGSDCSTGPSTSFAVEVEIDRVVSRFTVPAPSSDMKSSVPFNRGS